jgi:hypothetical protein
MATFTMRHELECDEARFWQVFLDREFNEAVYKALDFPAWKLLEQKETETEIVRHLKATPKLDAPAAVTKLLGASFGYDEEGRFDKAAKTWKFVMKTNTLSEKLRNEGKVRIEARGEGKCTRVVDIVTEAKVFGVGGLIEGAFEKSLRGAWQKSADFMNRWLKEHP